MPKQTPSQTVGPYFAYALTPQLYARSPLATNRLSLGGQRIRIEGRVFDGAGQPVIDSLVEIWQADAEGLYAPDAAGFGRCGTDDTGAFSFDTVKPGPIGDGQAPHIMMTVFARGMPAHAFTRLLFSDEVDANAADPILATVPAERRDNLIAVREDAAGGIVYRFDIHLQGERETVFFDV